MIFACIALCQHKTNVHDRCGSVCTEKHDRACSELQVDWTGHITGRLQRGAYFDFCRSSVCVSCSLNQQLESRVLILGLVHKLVHDLII